MSTREVGWHELEIIHEAKTLTVRIAGPCAAGVAFFGGHYWVISDPVIKTLIVAFQGFMIAGPIIAASVFSPQVIRRMLVERMLRESKIPAFRVGFARRGTKESPIEDEGLLTFGGGVLFYRGLRTQFLIGRDHVESVETIRTGHRSPRYSILVRNDQNYRSFAFDDCGDSPHSNSIGLAIEAWLKDAPPDATLRLPPSMPRPWTDRATYLGILFWIAAYLQVNGYLRSIPSNSPSFGPIVATFLTVVALAFGTGILQFLYLRTRARTVPTSTLINRYVPSARTKKRKVETGPGMAPAPHVADDAPHQSISS